MSRYFNHPQGYLTVQQLMDRWQIKNKLVILRAIQKGDLPAYTFPDAGTRYFVKDEDAQIYEKKRNTPQPVSVA